MACILCRKPKVRGLCESCEITLFSTDVIYEMYSTGVVEDWVREFVREIGFTFRRDYKRARRYFTVAEEIILKAIQEHPNEPIPLDELSELRAKDQAEIRSIMEVLRQAHIAHLEADQVILDDLGLKISQVLPTGEPLGSPTYQGSIDEIHGALCVALAKPLIDRWLEGEKGSGRPRNYLLNMNRLSRHIERNIRVSMPIQKDLDGSEFFTPKRESIQIGERQWRRILGDLLGLHGPPNLVESVHFKPDGNIRIFLKDSVVVYLEKMRERWRERLRERGRI